MNAVHGGLTWSTRRLVALFAVLMLAALLAGGAGGYLIRGASTLVVKQPVSVSPVQPQSVTGARQGPFTEPHDVIGAPRAGQGPLTEPHDAIAATGSGQGPFTEPHDDGK